MTFVKYLAFASFLVINLCEIEAHGRLMDPVNRGSAFRKNFSVPANYDDAGNYCGGHIVQYSQNGGKCGECGDNYALARPRPNENGGTYGKGIIVKTYNAGSVITADVELTANHLGYYKFALCPLKHKKELEIEECFNNHKLKLANSEFQYNVETSRTGHYFIELRLPQGLTCEHCVLRWEYTAGNEWGTCPDGEDRKGCSPQETFRTCSDIKIQ